ncbi:DUF2971 domain-containing protein [Labrenzia sp. VG12]|uniref:DUF2971 domain-containing protein n=1 Tax=Labrenzia sp. VG12 TaxID=2021862 RepID=UPI000B8C19E4|nr:DUF2971 domain-containing protein [Labrenzia sp. VG12]ASP32683.1 hypothetical protein CHH27_05015 [Labrenzia sp. VG12]
MDPFSNFDISAEQLRIFSLFHPRAFKRTASAITSNQRLVHYTSANTALKIIKNEAVWARNSSCMNDFMELEYGLECLTSSLAVHRERYIEVFDNIFDGFTAELTQYFNDWLPTIRSDTYITCLSEHLATEDTLGRLSMWRAYGGQTGVAFVVSGKPFLTPSDALNAYTSPVEYLSRSQFEQEFIQFIESIQGNATWVKSLGRDTVKAYMFAALRFAMLCTKHPGFHEEREWRVIYSPKYEHSKKITIDVESIGGTPQKVCKIPLKDIPEEGLTGIEVPSLLDRIIIGPTQYPVEMREAFIDVLEKAGVAEAEQKVIISDIPLRT